MRVEELLTKLGKPSGYQLLVYFCLWVCNSTASINHLLMAVIGHTPPFSCTLPKPPKSNISNIYGELRGISSVSETTASECSLHQYTNTSHVRQVTCPDKWTFQTMFENEATIVTEWSLVCDNKYLVSLASTLYFVGVSIGGAVFGQLGDSYGRKFVLLVALYSYLVISVGVYFTNSIVSFIVLRTMVGFLIQGIQMSSYVLLVELTAKKYRPIFAGIFEIFWSIGMIWLAALSWKYPSWKHLQLVLCLPSLVTLSFIIILPESIRWLANKKCYKKADEIAYKIAKFNKVQLPDDLELYLDHPNIKEGSTKKYTVLNLFKTPNIRKKTLILGFAWFAGGFSYFGLLLSSGGFPGNRYRTFLISSCAELIAGLGTFFIIKYLPRRIPLSMCYLCGGVMCITCGILRNNQDKAVQEISTTLFIVGRFFLTACFPIIALFSVETFPTVIRSIGVGTCAFSTRLGAVIAPQILLLEVISAELPFILFGITSIIASLGILCLPETRKQQLPETIEEIEKLQTSRTSELLPVPSTAEDS